MRSCAASAPSRGGEVGPGPATDQTQVPLDEPLLGGGVLGITPRQGARKLVDQPDHPERIEIVRAPPFPEQRDADRRLGAVAAFSPGHAYPLSARSARIAAAPARRPFTTFACERSGSASFQRRMSLYSVTWRIMACT